MFDVFYIGSKPGLFDHEKAVTSIEQAQQQSRTRFCWVVTYLADYSDWDWLWEPPPWQSQYTHVWPSQHHEFSGTYLVPKNHSIEYHFHDRVVPNRHQQSRFQTMVTNVEFDYTWAPHPLDPPYIYVFGNQWWSAEVMPTVEYHVPGATERKYMDSPKATLTERHSNRWHTLQDCTWDYSWCPDPGDPPYIYVFGNQWWSAEVMPTVEYHVPGATECKYMAWPRAGLLPDKTNWSVPPDIDSETFDFSWCPNPGAPPMTYQFGTQWQRTGGPVYEMPGANSVHYQSQPRATKTGIDAHWHIPTDIDPTSFDWTWHPDSTEPAYIYQFATQHQRTGGPRYTVPGAVEVKYVDQIKVDSVAVIPIVEIDHLDGNAGQIANTTRRVRYFDNYKDTLIRLARSIVNDHAYVWICSSICDYKDFDFSWHPEAWQATMLHVFASNEQKFGDTFFMHVPSFIAIAESKALLDWCEVNFVPDIFVPRRDMPVVQHSDNTHVDVVKNHQWTAPLTVFTTDSVLGDLPTVSLWRDKTKAIVPTNFSASTVIVPQAAASAIKNQLYDYAIIDKSFRLRTDQMMDVIFISYDEPDADKNFSMLKQQVSRAKRVHGVSGMEYALEAAADLSSTPWYYAVFAKTRVHEKFDFSFVPDYMQQPKHYIFDCLNSSNLLQYGHMGIVMYNCMGIRQINQQNDFGLDYTLSWPHESVPVLSCHGDFATTPYHAWRTAFRECAKLAYFESQVSTVDGQYRLKTWQSFAQGSYAEWVLTGAKDGIEFFASTQGNLQTLKQSFRWTWLREYFENRYGNLQ